MQDLSTSDNKINIGILVGSTLYNVEPIPID